MRSTPATASSRPTCANDSFRADVIEATRLKMNREEHTLVAQRKIKPLQLYCARTIRDKIVLLRPPGYQPSVMERLFKSGTHVISNGTSRTRFWSASPLHGEVPIPFMKRTMSLMWHAHLMPILRRHWLLHGKTVATYCSRDTSRCQRAGCRK